MSVSKLVLCCCFCWKCITVYEHYTVDEIEINENNNNDNIDNNNNDHYVPEKNIFGGILELACLSVRVSVRLCTKYYFLSKRWRGYQVTCSGSSSYYYIIITTIIIIIVVVVVVIVITTTASTALLAPISKT